MTTLAVPVKRGLKKSLQLLLMLLKIIIPVSCAVAVFDYYGLIEPAAAYFKPAMDLLGLPGEAALALLLGATVNTYAALGVLATISFTSQQITIIAVMLGICHDLPVESAVCSYTGLRVPVSAGLRLATAFAAGLALNLLYSIPFWYR